MYKVKTTVPEYMHLLQNFRGWLTILGYSPTSIPQICHCLDNFFRYQESMGRLTLAEMGTSDAYIFIQHLKTIIGITKLRPHKNGFINKYIQSLNLFGKYICKTGKGSIWFSIKFLKKVQERATWLTEAEVKGLYGSVSNCYTGLRDRAILAVFYGCGLRLREGVCLELKDIDPSRRTIHVRVTKRCKERLVPVPEKGFNDLKFYLDFVRPKLVSCRDTQSVFVTVTGGTKLSGDAIVQRITILARRAGIAKNVSPRTLRHSIATHLLKNGMDINHVRQFLGHSSLDSTQIYTHLTDDELLPEWQP